MILARNLPDTIYNTYEYTITGILGQCLSAIDLTKETNCDDVDATLHWKLIRLSNDKYVFVNINGKCLSGSFELVECDYDDSEQWMDISYGTESDNQKIMIVNQRGEYLDVPNAKFDDPKVENFISMVGKIDK